MTPTEGDPENEVETEGLGEAGNGATGQDDGQAVEDAGDAAEQPDDQEAGGESEVEGEPERPVSRGEKRFQTLSNSVKEANERATRLERELADERRQRQQAHQFQTEAQEREALALMSPEERSDYKLQKATQTFQQQQAAMAFQMQDQTDRMAYEAKAASNPVFKRYAAEVEERLQEQRSKGINVPREHLLRWIVGDRAISQAGGPRSKQTKEAGKRVAAQTVNGSGGGRSQQPSARGKTPDSAEGRLKDVYI